MMPTSRESPPRKSFYSLRTPQAAKMNTTIDQMWGFDPMQLLESVEFPNDQYERRLRRDRHARSMAIRYLDLDSTVTISLPSMDDDEGSSQALDALKSSTSEGRKTITDAQRLCRRNNMTGSTAALREDGILKEHLAKLAAALMIQSVFRGWRTRTKYIAVVEGRLSIRTLRAAPPDIGSWSALPYQNNLPSISPDQFRIQEKLVQRYHKFCLRWAAAEDSIPPTFPDFAATFIQSVWRMWAVRRKWLKFWHMRNGESARNVVDDTRKEMLRKPRKAGLPQNTWDQAARKIQRAWRGYYNIKIYHFHRDLIKFRLHGDPRKLLKFINPKESQIIDSATGIHVRFRLGGTAFPPIIFYKIFVHKSLVDMNSFSPRDYTKVQNKQLLPIDLFQKTGPLPPAEDPNGGWYQRTEQNGWRPVSEKLWSNGYQLIPELAAPKPTQFHHSKLIRRQDLVKSKRKRKLEWFHKMYTEGKQMSDRLADPSSVEQAAAAQLFHGMVSHAAEPPPKPDLENMDVDAYLKELEAGMDVDLLIKWTNALDFEAYYADWIEIAASGKSDDPTTLQLMGPAEEEETKLTLSYSPGLLEEDTLTTIDRHSSLGGVVIEDSARAKSRPWSGTSDRSVREYMISERDRLDF
ncbi:hypothetical protein DFS34DRAFT_610101 [Phlyctochytrium arcticum]|nr:hypothetical protein DFS34DRAFT_610101 [Phlyctochytrium arcticum]